MSKDASTFSDAAAAKVYQAPKLRVYGSIANLTKGSSGSIADTNQGSHNTGQPNG